MAEKLYLTKAETIAETALHQNAMANRKCLIPADGFYVWRQVSKKGLIPYRYFHREHQLFAFAGLWEEFEDGSGEIVHTFSIITTESNELISQSASRMPVILESPEAIHWLNASEANAVSGLKSYPANKMHGFAVSTRVNNPQNNDAQLIEPAPPADQFGNYSLFD